jgi:hypothetical protein
MRTIALATALIAALAAAPGCAKSDKAEAAPSGAEESDKTAEKIPEMTVDDLDHALAAKQAVAVDCNRASTRKRAGVVPGAILVSDDESYAPSELPADKATKLVFYCANPG